MKRKIISILTLTVFSFTTLLAQKKTVKKATSIAKTVAPKAEAQSTTTGITTASYDIKKSVKCLITSLPNGCSIVFKNPQINDFATDLVSKQKEEQSLIIKKYFVNQENNSVKDVTQNESFKGEEQSKQAAEVSVIAEIVDISSDVKVSKMVVSDIHFQIVISGNKKELKTDEGECYLPANLPDGSYRITVSWKWGMPKEGDRIVEKPGAVSFITDFKAGNCVDISENK